MFDYQAKYPGKGWHKGYRNYDNSIDCKHFRQRTRDNPALVDTFFYRKYDCGPRGTNMRRRNNKSKDIIMHRAYDEKYEDYY